MPMTRDTGEQRTRSDLLDFDNIGPADFDETLDRYAPSAVPDHGRKPRLPKRPTLVVWKRDPDHLYKPINDHFMEPSGDQFSASELRKHDIVRMLAKTAREHAPRLHWRRDDAISECIQIEILPDARFVASSLAAADVPKVLDRFVEVLWDEIDRQRKNNTSRRRDYCAKKPTLVKSIT